MSGDGAKVGGAPPNYPTLSAAPVCLAPDYLGAIKHYKLPITAYLQQSEKSGWLNTYDGEEGKNVLPDFLCVEPMSILAPGNVFVCLLKRELP